MTHTHTAHTHKHTRLLSPSYTHICTRTHTTPPHGAKKQGHAPELTYAPGLPQKLGMRESASWGTWSCVVSSSLRNTVALETAFLGEGLQETGIRRRGFVAVCPYIWKHNYRTPAPHSKKIVNKATCIISILTNILLRSFPTPKQPVQMLSVALLFLVSRTLQVICNFLLKALNHFTCPQTLAGHFLISAFV